ncbi:MAG: MGH1-like glycoside hydrolase domain-containing protein [Thermomicrobiales bacterium]
MAFPTDDYTPHEYLDLPGHTRNLTPLGVVRSHQVGFRWHFPAYAGLYGGRRETYRAGFRLVVDGAIGLDDFNTVSSPYHSKNLIRFDLARGDANGHAEWFLVGEHALCARIEVAGASRLSLHVEYTRFLSANGEWGESGLVGRRTEDGLVLLGFEDGDAFVLWTSRPPDDLGVSLDEVQAETWAREPAPGMPAIGFLTVVGNRGDTVALHAALGFRGADGEPIDAILARGRTLLEARQRLREARRSVTVERARLIAEDDAFWANAPALEGDWPAHWRRGLVYDLETLRTMIKPPVGIYAHVWDAMQIHAPRVVLAETAIDALLLSYADPAVAQELMLGVVLDAPEANVPCSQEDGSYNLVAADGTACGTAPQWCYPWVVLDWLFALRPDRRWLTRLYPRLAEHLLWWLTSRSDADGWLGYACSWESGQDDSPRFGAQPLGGGHPIRHVRPVDLHAAFAQAAAVMARFAGELGYRHDVGTWQTMAEEFTARTDRLWNGERYADIDGHTGQFTTVDDLMLLAPVALGVASAERVAAMTARIAAISADELVWPGPTWTAIDAARHAGSMATVAALAGAVCDRAYRFRDVRRQEDGRTMPGVTCEYWPLHGRCGGEGYGWGAFTVHLLLHDLLGLSPTPDGLCVQPNLPAELRVPGRSYRLRWTYRGTTLVVAVEPVDEKSVRVRVDEQMATVAWGEACMFALLHSADSQVPISAAETV